MISILISATADLPNLTQLVEHIFNTVSNRDNVEVIVGILDQDLLDSFQKNIADYRNSLRIIARIPGVLDINQDQNEIFNYLYQQTHFDSCIVMPIDDVQAMFEHGWDDKVDQSFIREKKRLGHEAFAIRTEHNIFYSSVLLDVISGFGLINDTKKWIDIILDKARLVVGDSLVANEGGIASSGLSSVNVSSSVQPVFDQITTSLADSVARYIQRSKNVKEVRKTLDKMDLVEISNHIIDNYQSFDTIKIPLIRHACDSSIHVLIESTVNFLNVILCAVLRQKNMISSAIIPKEWHDFMDSWGIKGMRKIKSARN